jgi:Tfp pilus assembly protein PilV
MERFHVMRKAAGLKPGISLPEVYISIIMVSIIIIGAANFKYFAVRDAVRSERQIVAARTALLFSEAWAGNGGQASFDPNSVMVDRLNLSPGTVFGQPADYNAAGSYNVELGGFPQNVTLSYKDFSSDLRALNTVVIWSTKVGDFNEISDMDAAFNLTTYCNR